MGTLIDAFCCIDTNELLENTNFAKYSRLSSSNDRENSNIGSQLPSSELKALPIMDINSSTPKTTKEKINTLSKLPISTKNLIRRVSGNPFENYKLLKKLGSGTFGHVFKVMHIKSGNIRAMKIIPKNNLMPGFADKDIIREINIMKDLDHPHVIKIYEFYRDDKNYYLINEYCTEGDLSEKMIKLKQLPEPIVKILMAQIFSAVLYLNNQGIIHGDLKLENILVDSYLDDGNIQKEKKNNFISSLIQDARNVQNYLRNINVKRVNTSVFNRKKIQERLNLFKKSDKGLNKFRKNKVYLYENPDNIINEETKEMEINNEETKDSYEPLKKLPAESNIFGFQSNDEDEDEENDKSDDINNSSYYCKSPKKDNFNPNPKKVLDFKLEDKFDYKINKKNISSSIKIGMEEDEEERIQVERKINKRLTYNYNKLHIKNFELKLIDFGCSKIFSKQKKTTFEDTIGTLVYCSPEVLKNNYDQKCDIWSCGVIMYRLLCGRFPFSGKTEEEITKKILN